MAYSTAVFDGAFPAPLAHRAAFLGVGRPVTSTTLAPLTDGVLGVIGTDDLPLFSETVDPIGAYQPFRVSWRNVTGNAQPLSVDWLPAVTLEESTGAEALLPHHALPVIGAPVGGFGVLYHFSQWDSTVTRVRFPLDPSVGSGASYAENWFQPFSQEWDYQMRAPACTGFLRPIVVPQGFLFSP